MQKNEPLKLENDISVDLSIMPETESVQGPILEMSTEIDMDADDTDELNMAAKSETAVETTATLSVDDPKESDSKELDD